jgi:GR25 family glycosyltransferase involved in LPS biosynthesis
MEYNMDIFNIPLYYISFNPNTDLETNFKKQGFKDINHFSAVNGKLYTPIDLLENDIITIRVYNDLIYGRHQSTGMPTLGGVGCTLSHLSLWNYCVDNDLQYIIITEEDARFNKSLSDYDINNIKKSLNKKNGGFVSSHNFKKNSEYFFGTHFYIITNGCARELVKYALPIDLQTDAYINNLNNRGKIDLEGYQIANQKIHKSNIQNMCIKCILPKGKMFYIFIIIVVVIFIISYIIMKNKLTKSKIELDSCLQSSCLQSS